MFLLQLFVFLWFVGFSLLFDLIFIRLFRSIIVFLTKIKTLVGKGFRQTNG